MSTPFFKRHISLKVSFFVTAILVFANLIGLIIVKEFSSLLLSAQNAVAIIILFSVFFVLLQAVLVFFAISLFVSRPIQQILQSIKRVGEGFLSERCYLESKDEFEDLSIEFNQMMGSIHDIHEHRQEIEKKLYKAEEGLKYKKALEDKARIIEQMNTQLTDAFSDVSLLFMVSQYLGSILEIEELIEKVQKVFEEHFQCDGFAIYFLKQGNKKLWLAAQKGLGLRAKDKDELISIDEGLAGYTVSRGDNVYIENVVKPQEFTFSKKEASFKGSVFSITLKVRGQVIGVLAVCRHQIQAFTPTDRQSLKSIANQIAVVYDRALLYTKTKELAVRDELTGVFNRRYFYQMLNREFKRAKRFNRHLSLLMIDLDYFKRFNDTYGHIKGDELLREFAILLKSNTREIDVLARYGGEEFIMLLPDTKMDHALLAANKLKKIINSHKWKTALGIDPSLRKDFQTVTMSVGVSSYPEFCFTTEDLIKQADVALYQAKRDGRDLVRAFKICDLLLDKSIFAENDSDEAKVV